MGWINGKNVRKTLHTEMTEIQPQGGTGLLCIDKSELVMYLLCTVFVVLVHLSLVLLFHYDTSQELLSF